MKWVLSVLTCLLFCANGSRDIDTSSLEESIRSKQGSVVAPEHEYKTWMGTELVVELMNITELDLLGTPESLETMMRSVSKELGLSVIKSTSHKFDHGGSVFLLLQDSHVVVHTWPNAKYLALDLFTRSEESKVYAVAAGLAEALGADIFVGARLPRGVPGDLLQNQQMMSPAAAVEEQEKLAGEDKLNPEASLAETWAEMIPDDDLIKAFSNLQHDFDMLEKKKSQWQMVEFIKNRENGDVCLLLDGTVQICESYNAAYSEVYVHLPVAFLNSFKTALIIGGGDALALREVLKYKCVERVVQLELDELVPEMSEKYLNVNAHLPGRDTTDPRVEWIFGDAAKTIVQLVKNGEQFDLLLLDISETDPSGTVSTEDFFRFVAQVLSPTGIFIKNEFYQRPTAMLFDEYLEVRYPVPMITQQTFVLGSNGTSLFLPHFKLLVENKVQTSFLAHGPSTRYRQLRSLVRRYSKRGLDYQNQATQEFEKRFKESPWRRQHGDHPGPLEDLAAASLEECAEERDADVCEEELDHPCLDESEDQSDVVFQAEWTEECETSPPDDELQIEIFNASPHPVDVAWLDEASTNTDEAETVIPNLLPGTSRRLGTFFDHQFLIRDSEEVAAILAKFHITHQIYSHPYIVFHGLHQGVSAARNLDEAKGVKRTASPPKPL